MNNVISVLVGGGWLQFNKRTGEPVRRVRREVIEAFENECSECGHVRKHRIYSFSLDKRVKPENIGERYIEPTTHYIPLYEG